MQALKLFTAEQIRRWDAFTMTHEPISPADLMERAAKACVVFIKTRFPEQNRFTVLCGPGNNGGDGLAIARLLCADKKTVRVLVCKAGSNCTAEMRLNEQRLKEQNKAELHDIASTGDFPELTGQEFLIDALFGSGLSRPLEGIAEQLIKHIHSSRPYVLSVDIPSGMYADASSAGNTILRSDLCLSFQVPKRAFLYPENAPHLAEWTVLDIGLSPEFYQNEASNAYLLDKVYITSLLRPRAAFAHKGQFGHCLMLAGAYGKMGAAVLAAKAASRSGCGLLSLRVPACGTDVLQMAVPEAMLVPDTAEQHIASVPETSAYTAIGAGPGIGQHPDTRAAIRHLITHAETPLLLDADALNILATEPGLADSLPKGSILTPHVREFERLAGKASSDFERHSLQLAYARQYGVYVLLKGKYSCLCGPDGVSYYNNTGNPGMAKGGSGDVLTGLLSGLLAQAYSPLEAALIGMYVHGLAGDIAAENKGLTGMNAGDVAAAVADAFLALEGKA